MTGPLTQVLTTVESGVRTVPAIAQATGLNPDLVNAAIDHLIREGRMRALPLNSCASGTCGGCSLFKPRCSSLPHPRSSCRRQDPRQPM